MASPLPVPGKRFVIGVPYVWLFFFFLLPFLILLYISLSTRARASTPSSRSGTR
jgi:putrescine transport system permease protein